MIYRCYMCGRPFSRADGYVYFHSDKPVEDSYYINLCPNCGQQIIDKVQFARDYNLASKKVIG
jgi:DNA-directed RNA polymerase subunit RPC12/RpoP